MTAGITWPGVVLWDDLRTLDYLASRPDVDRQRLGCIGLSVGGYRSFLLAALDERIKAAVDVCWMTSYASNIQPSRDQHRWFHVSHSRPVSLSGLPDLAGLIAPRSIFVINGSKDTFFPSDGSTRPIGRSRRALEGRCGGASAVPAVPCAAPIQSCNADRGLGMAWRARLSRRVPDRVRPTDSIKQPGGTTALRRPARAPGMWRRRRRCSRPGSIRRARSRSSG